MLFTNTEFNKLSDVRRPSDGLSVWVPGFAALRAALTFGPS